MLSIIFIDIIDYFLLINYEIIMKFEINLQKLLGAVNVPADWVGLEKSTKLIPKDDSVEHLSRIVELLLMG